MNKKKEAPKGRVVYVNNPKLTNDDICKELVGMSIKDWAADILKNENGKYNHFYKN